MKKDPVENLCSVVRETLHHLILLTEDEEYWSIELAGDPVYDKLIVAVEEVEDATHVSVRNNIRLLIGVAQEYADLCERNNYSLVDTNTHHNEVSSILQLLNQLGQMWFGVYGPRKDK